MYYTITLTATIKSGIIAHIGRYRFVLFLHLVSTNILFLTVFYMLYHQQNSTYTHFYNPYCSYTLSTIMFSPRLTYCYAFFGSVLVVGSSTYLLSQSNIHSTISKTSYGSCAADLSAAFGTINHATLYCFMVQCLRNST